MIELERDESQDIQVWADSDFSHVIVEETPDTYRFDGGAPGFWVRYEEGEDGPFPSLDVALIEARETWDDEVTLAPANRLRRDIEDGDENDGMQWLVEYLATYGTAGIDAQALAQRVFERIEES
jgi:hypothetical protein